MKNQGNLSLAVSYTLTVRHLFCLLTGRHSAECQYARGVMM